MLAAKSLFQDKLGQIIEQNQLNLDIEVDGLNFDAEIDLDIDFDEIRDRIQDWKENMQNFFDDDDEDWEEWENEWLMEEDYGWDVDFEDVLGFLGELGDRIDDFGGALGDWFDNIRDNMKPKPEPKHNHNGHKGGHKNGGRGGHKHHEGGKPRHHEQDERIQEWEDIFDIDERPHPRHQDGERHPHREGNHQHKDQPKPQWNNNWDDVKDVNDIRREMGDQFKENFMNTMQPFFEQWEPVINNVEEYTVLAYQARARTVIRLFVGASEYVYELYHAYCEDVPSNMTENEKDDFFTEQPIKMMVCDEKVQMAFNWASMLITLPALKAHRDFQGIMKFLRTENQEERLNQTIVEGLEPMDFDGAIEKVSTFFEEFTV